MLVYFRSGDKTSPNKQENSSYLQSKKLAESHIRILWKYLIFRRNVFHGIINNITNFRCGGECSNAILCGSWGWGLEPEPQTRGGDHREPWRLGCRHLWSSPHGRPWGSPVAMAHVVAMAPWRCWSVELENLVANLLLGKERQEKDDGSLCDQQPPGQLLFRKLCDLKKQTNKQPKKINNHCLRQCIEFLGVVSEYEVVACENQRNRGLIDTFFINEKTTVPVPHTLPRTVRECRSWLRIILPKKSLSSAGELSIDISVKNHLKNTKKVYFFSQFLQWKWLERQP